MTTPVRAAAASVPEPTVRPGSVLPSDRSADGPVRQWAAQHRGAGEAVPLARDHGSRPGTEQPAARVTVSQGDGRVEVRGADRAQVERALSVTRRLELVIATPGDPARAGLMELFTELGSVLPAPSVMQAQRAAEHRRQLLDSGYFTHETLGVLRHATLASSTRTWVARQRAHHRVFTVSHQNLTIIPAFQFTADGAPRDELQPLLAELTAAGIPPWQVWTWLVSTTPLLSGGIPEQVARVDSARARTAGRRFAARLHHAPAA